MDMVTRGRFILQGFVLGEFYRDLEKMEEKETPVGMIWQGAWATTKAGVGTIGIWTPWFKAKTVGKIGTKVATTLARTTAPVALGYTLGATAGTIIAEEVFDEGQAAYDLYTNPDVLSEGGILYETADMLGNAKFIFDHYNQAGHFTASRKPLGEWLGL